MTDLPFADLKKRATLFSENIAEAATACLLAMVQGNLLALGLNHWLIASRTGIVAGSIASFTVLIARRDTRWLVAAVLGTFTAIVDFFVHPGTFGSTGSEAIVTGIGAGVLSYGFSTLLHVIRYHRGGRG